MSSEPQQTAQSGSSSKPITGHMQLQTKIRLIIQQVLAATMRKLSQFNEKVQTFEKFFFTYTQRINDIDERGKTNEQALSRLFETVLKNKENLQGQLIKLQQKHESLKLQKQELSEEVKQINKKINTINRQNETINNQFSNTKKKFLEYSQQMSGLKEEVSWKITRYVQQTAQINTKIQLNNEQIKKEYFNINLALQKNKEKYEEIIFTKDKQDSLNQQFTQQMANLNNLMKQKTQSINTLNKKLEDMDTALYSKIKSTESKLDKKIEQLTQTNQKIEKSVSKVDGFSKILEELREDTEKVRRQLLKKFEQSDQKHTDKVQKEVLAINMNLLNYSKSTDKKIRDISQLQQKNVQFFNQKMQYLKIQIQTEISSKATRMLEQKSKTQSGVANTALQQIQQKINKLTLQTKKEINKMENIVKEVKLQVKHQMEDIKDAVDTKISTTVKAIEESSGSGVSPQFIQSINQKIQKSALVVDQRLFQFGKEMNQQDDKIQGVVNLKNQTERMFKQLRQENDQKISDMDEKMNNKAQSMLYTLKKIRGDAIINHEFTQKQFKQLRKSTQITGRQASTILKMFPAIGQCINLMMCLIFDAEYQHAKVFQDSLPNPSKNVVKFQNLVEGVLYQFMEKRKPGYIMYRHKEQKKIDIVKATFNGYIKIWEDLFGNDFKDRQQFIPKTFYKNYIQRNGVTTPVDRSPNKELSHPQMGQRRESQSKDKLQLSMEESQNLMRNPGSENNIPQNMNRSFRNRRVATMKSKEVMKMVVHEDQTLEEQK